MIIGISIGFVLGLVAGIMIMILMVSTFRKEIESDALIKLLGQFTIVISFLFGSTFGASQILSSIPKEDWITYYIPSAAVVFLLCLVYPTIKLIGRVGQELGRRSND